MTTAGDYGVQRHEADSLRHEQMEQHREQVLRLLGVHFASDNITVEELDHRMAAAVQASSHLQLDELLTGLPPLPHAFDPNREDSVTRMVAPDEVPPRGFVGAIMGGAERKGRWLVPRHLKVWAIMGGVDLDLRQARFAPGVTEIEVSAVMGGVDVTLPPDVTVEYTGIAFLGGFGANTGDADRLDPSRPIVRLSGFACMGGVDAKVRQMKPKAFAKFQRRLARLRKE